MNEWFVNKYVYMISIYGWIYGDMNERMIRKYRMNTTPFCVYDTHLSTYNFMIYISPHRYTERTYDTVWKYGMVDKQYTDVDGMYTYPHPFWRDVSDSYPDVMMCDHLTLPSRDRYAL